MATKWSQLIDDCDNTESEQSFQDAPFAFTLCNSPDPKSFVKQRAGDRFMNFHKGTTTLAFEFQGGLMVAVDSRASMGSYISTQEVYKVQFITDSIICTIAGCAQDCQFWLRYLSKLSKIYRLRENGPKTVGHTAKTLADIFYSYRGYGLSCGIIVAGWNKSQGTSGVYLIDDSGSCTKGKLFSIGSGSAYAYGVLDGNVRYDMTVSEAHEVAKKAIYHATRRDGGSGGLVRVYHVSATGVTTMTSGQDVDEVHYQYY